jgi:hypothetical protein
VVLVLGRLGQMSQQPSLMVIYYKGSRYFEPPMAIRDWGTLLAKRRLEQ